VPHVAVWTAIDDSAFRRVTTVSVRWLDFPATRAQQVAVFREGLRERGWIEGKNLVIETRYAEGNVSSRQDEAVIAGKYWDGSSLVCGVFDLSLMNGNIRRILEDDCSDAITRTDISLSPDSRYAIAIHKRSLELIDIASGRSRILGEGFLKAAWPPDGKWIAASRYSSLQARMILFEPRTFTARKTLQSSTVLKVSWSPDSHFLLGRTLEIGCGPDEYTYETFEIETARASVIESSRCKVFGNDVGWVDKTIAKQ
jgi:WD40 repeat protein